MRRRCGVRAAWAGLEDGVLSVHVADDFHRYVDTDGLLTLLVRADGPAEYVAVITTSLDPPGVKRVPRRAVDAERTANSVGHGGGHPIEVAVSGPHAFLATARPGPECASIVEPALR